MHSKNDFESDRAIGYCLLRATLGINIFLHGVSRMLAGTGNFAASFSWNVSRHTTASGGCAALWLCASVDGGDGWTAGSAWPLDTVCLSLRGFVDFCTHVRHCAPPGLGDCRT